MKAAYNAADFLATVVLLMGVAGVFAAFAYGVATAVTVIAEAMMEVVRWGS